MGTLVVLKETWFCHSGLLTRNPTSTPALGARLPTPPVTGLHKLRETFSLNQGLEHCERLLVGLDGVLADLGLRSADLGGIAVTVGPGSFTGLRIGVAAAQGLALAQGLPIVGISSLEALAHGAAGWWGPLVPCLDARRGEVYFCACHAGADGIELLTADAVLPARDVAPSLPFALADGERVLVIGDAAESLASALEGAGITTRHAADLDRYPRAAHVAILGSRRLAAGQGVGPEEIEPIYLRRSDAEISRERIRTAGGS
jgi:tRNA threonylcarbamoyladenosine biosynthesis protein TsaB